jgi:hypothetical protein
MTTKDEKAIVALTEAITTNTADIRMTVERRFFVTPEAGVMDPPYVALSVDEDGEPIGAENYFVDVDGDEWPLSPEEEYAVAAAIAGARTR